MLIKQEKSLNLLSFNNTFVPVILQQNMHILADKFIIHNEISRCRYGSVHLASNTKNDKVYAVKFVPTNVVKSFDRKVLRPALRTQLNADPKLGKLPAEYVYGKICESPEIIRYEDCYVDQGCWAMVMELPKGYTVLQDYVISNGPLSKASLIAIIHQIVTAMSTCIVKGIDHRNMSAENILYDPKTDKIKLIGFGHATLAADKEPYPLPRNMPNPPPEAKQYGECIPLQTTVWSIGCLVKFCAIGAGRLSRMARASHDIVANVSEEIGHVVNRCLEPNPRNRILFTNLQRYIKTYL